MSLGFLGSAVALAMLQGALVALPRQDALPRLTGLSSPMWALLLPGLIILGTFGLVLIPSGASDLVIAATFAMPPLAALAAFAVIRRNLAAGACGLIVVAGITALFAHGLVGHIAASLVSACGALLVGTVIVRLLPGRWLLVAVGVMCVADVVLMHFAIGRASSHLLDAATREFHGPTFDAAEIGRITTEYPDMLLAAVIGAVMAGRPQQRLTAMLVVGCVGSYDLLMLFVQTVPATPPLCAALLLSELHYRFGPPARRTTLAL